MTSFPECSSSWLPSFDSSYLSEDAILLKLNTILLILCDSEHSDTIVISLALETHALKLTLAYLGNDFILLIFIEF